LGEPQEAVTIFEQSLSEMSELATRMPQGNAPLILSDVQSRLGDLQFRLSQFERAERLYTRSLELRQAGLGRFHLVIAESYLAQARLQSWVENGANDVEHLEAEAISITEACAGPRSPYVSRVRMEIATEKLRRGNVDAAKEELVKLRDAVARDLGDDSPELIPLLLRLSEAELTSENDEAAEAILSEAARILPETPAPAFALGIYPSLGKTRLRLENLDGAEEAYRNLLDYLTTNHGPNNYHSNLAWRGLSETTIRRGEIEETLKAFQRLAVLHDSVFDYLPFDPSHDSLRVITADSVEEDLQRLVHFVGSNCRDEAETIRFAAGFTARCKHFRIDGVGRDWLGRLAKRHPDHAAELLHLRDLRRQIALRLMKGAGSEGIAFHETLLREWQARANEIESRLTDHFPELLVIRSGIRGAVDAIFDHLPRDTGLIDIIHVMPGWFSNSIQKGKSWLTPNYFAFVYRPDQQEVTMVDLGGDRDIDPLIESLNSATGSSKEFWKRVWEPLLYHVGPVQKLIVSPDGEFLRFHPGAVQAPDGSWLLDQYEVRVVGAARDLESPRRNTVRRAGAQILVASDFGPMRETSSGGGFFGKLKRFFSGTSSTGSIAPARWPTQRQALRELATEGMSYPPLPGSRDEGFEIARLHHASIREGTQATAEQLLNPNGVGVLHLNSYTFSRPDYRKTNPKETPKKRSRTWENPLDGYGFALGGANRMLLRSLSESELERGVGIVTLCDVQEADWSQLDLCTLSLEPAPKSEILAARYGLVGVERTIRWAGVRSICFHPDPIPAEERRKILVAFHKHYLTSKTATEAYRKMAAELRDSVPDWRRFLCFEC
jgi:tetratricopeptide (TPR) repeat protein